MSEFVVYEDTPIAEYLNAIESGESSVKPAPLHLGIHQTDMKPKTFTITQLSESLYRYWRQSLFHDTFSVSLPTMEEMAFEEKFKYLIVTSPLLNDTLSTHPKQKQQKHHSPTGPSPFHATAAHTRAGRIGTMATLSGLLAAIGLERFFPFSQHPLQHHRHQHQQIESAARVTKAITPTITMALASGVSLYFVYRHLRRSSIRKLYQYALTQLQDVLEQSQLLDNKVHRALLTIQEIELVSRGYRLSTPLSPISRIEQASKSKRCARLRTQLAGLLRHAFIIYEEAIIDMTDRVNKPTLSRLFDMYNIHSVASLSAASIPTEHNNNNSTDNENDITLDYLKMLAHLMHLKRRECMLQFLALSVMTGGHESIRHGYEAGWRNINTVLFMLGNETKGFVKQVVDAMETEFDKSSTLDMETSSDASLSTNTDTRKFIHRLSTLDQHLRTMEARVYLCNDELQKRQRILTSSSSKQTPTNQKDTNNMLELEQQQQALKMEYMAMEKDIQQLAIEWASGKSALESLLVPPSDLVPPPVINTNDISPAPLPTPTMTPTADRSDDHPFVVHSYEASELLDLPLASKPSVYESVDDDSVDNATTTNGDQPKKSRMERIAEMKQKREQEAKEKSSKLDTQTYVYELKNVLDRRIQELDLANDDHSSQ